MDSGFGAALIQKPTLLPADASTVFYFNLMIAAALSALLYAARRRSRFFITKRLLLHSHRVLCAQSCHHRIRSCSDIPAHQTNRVQRADIGNYCCGACGGAIGIFMAIRGYGVWSLVGQSLGGNATVTVLLWFVCDWRPAWVFSIRALRGMFTFGSRLLASGMIFTVVGNMHSLVIGKLFTATELGLFTQARRLQEAPTGGLTAILSRVALPVFAEIQNDDARLRLGVQKGLTTAVFVNFPLMIGLAACAKPAVVLLLTEKWLRVHAVLATPLCGWIDPSPARDQPKPPNRQRTVRLVSSA